MVRPCRRMRRNIAGKPKHKPSVLERSRPYPRVMELTYPDLVRRLYDLERLAEPPVPGERGGCMSSYDRRSRYDPDTDSYIDWDANDDGDGFIREEGKWKVAFEQ